MKSAAEPLATFFAGALPGLPIARVALEFRILLRVGARVLETRPGIGLMAMVIGPVPARRRLRFGLRLLRRPLRLHTAAMFSVLPGNDRFVVRVTIPVG